MVLVAGAATARAERPRPSILLGGAPESVFAAPLPDPLLPVGPRITFARRPDSSEPAACSTRWPVCVHRAPGDRGATALRELAALERAWARLVASARLPAPRPDSGAGGSRALDWYPERAPLRVEPDTVAPGDRASAVCLGGADTSPERGAFLCLAESIALGLDAGESPALRRSWATELWWALGEPQREDYELVDDAQAHPERALTEREAGASVAGGALFFEYLESARGYGLGSLGASLFALAAGETAPGSFAWNDEPDAFDVLRHSAGTRAKGMANLLIDFAIARAFVGDRDDGEHLPTLGWAGAFGRARMDWSIPLSKLPKRVAISPPLEPTGAVYVYVPFDEPIPELGLGFQAEWERPSPLAWALVKIAPDGGELGRIDVPFQERGTSIEHSVVDLGGAVGLLVVGTNVGGTDASFPFDPDWSPFVKTGCTIYLARL